MAADIVNKTAHNTEVEEKLEKQLTEIDSNKLPDANILVAGITGTGKSTLLNAIFGSELAATGKGQPVTAEIKEYYNADIPVRIWDTVGLELDAEKTTASLNAIKQTIADRANYANDMDCIHAIWYCIHSESNRYQGAELKFIEDLHSIGVPFIIVLTQCIGDPTEINEFESYIRELNSSKGMNDVEIVQVCAKPFKLRGVTIDAFGLEDLVNITVKKIPDFIKSSLIAAQQVSAAQKRVLCEKVIDEYVDLAQKGFWDKIPIANLFATNSKISKMFIRIGRIYNTVLDGSKIDEIIKELGSIDIENGFWGLLSPLNRGYLKKQDDFFNAKKQQGLEVSAQNLNKSERVARLLAYYGYNFLDAIEELWEELTAEQLKKVDIVIGALREKLKRKFQLKK